MCSSKKVSQQEVVFLLQALLRELLDAVAHMHAHGIVHRDLKLENLVFGKSGDVSTVTIVDFGLAKAALARERLEGVTGTLWYTAPEVLKGVPYSPVVDLWSIGVVGYLLLTGALSLLPCTIRGPLVERPG
jgi:serine/threonine protein kinase